MTKTTRCAQVLTICSLLWSCSKMSTTWAIVPTLANGFAAAPSGTAQFYLPGTTVPLVIAGDSSGTGITNPVALNAQGAAVVYLSQLARMVVQTNGAVTVFDAVVNQDIDTSVATSSSAFSTNTLKGALDSALAKFGGQDFQYVPSGAWVGMTPQAWMNGVFRNVMAYGVVGATTVNDGVTPADSAIDAALADVAAAGGGIVYLPPGTYLCNAAHNIAGSSIVILGAGAASVVKNNAGAGNLFTTSINLSSLAFRNLQLSATTSSTGTAITATAFTGLTIENVKISGHTTALATSGGSDTLTIINGNFIGRLAVAGSRALSIADTTRLTVIGGKFLGSASTYDAEFFGTCDALVVTGASFAGGGSNAIRFDSTFGGSGVKFIGNRSISTAFFSFGNANDPSDFYQYGNGNDSYLVGILSGATGTPDRSKGDRVKFDGTTTGSAFIIAAPTPTPNRAGIRLTIQFYNHAGGAITGWTMNAIYKTTASIPTTDAHVITVVFEWDSQVSVWREVSRADTAV